MKSIYLATRLRGFFRQLVSAQGIEAKFDYDENLVYETNSLKTKIKNALGRSFIFDWLGFIQVIQAPNCGCDFFGSFNRFLNTKKPYFIYVENPTALFHYKLNRGKSFLGRRKINRELRNPNLKGLVFMSNACSSTFERVCGPISKDCFHETIYPLIPLNPFVDESVIKRRCREKELKLLFIAQGQRFLSKGGLEVIEAVKIMRSNDYSVSLRIITSLSDLSQEIREKISGIDGVEVNDFKFSFPEMQKIYADSTILLCPTSDDSFNLTVLEAIKSGLPIIGSRLYAIPEMVEDYENGFLCDPQYWFFDKNHIPNPKVWNNRTNTIYSGKISIEIVNFMIEKFERLYNNHEELERLSLKSLNKASKAPFAEEHIIGQWNRLILFLSDCASNQ